MHLSRDKKAMECVRERRHESAVTSAPSRERVQGSNRERPAACRSDGYVPRPKTVFCRCASKCETSRAILQQSPLRCGVWKESEEGERARTRGGGTKLNQPS